MLGMTYDNDADALYIRLSSASATATEEFDAGTLVDVDAAGRLVGVEVLRPSRAWPLAEILARFQMDAGDRALLQALFATPAHMVPFVSPDQAVVSTEVDAELMSA